MFGLLPFFEGGETANGLFLIHSVCLLGLAVTILTKSRLWLPSFFAYILPFVISLVVSALVAGYKYSAFLQFWDYCIAGLFIIAVFTFFKENEDAGARLVSYAFVIVAVGLLASVLLNDTLQLARGRRLNGSFLNSNDFAAFSLLAVLHGLYLFERESSRIWKRTILFMLSFLTVFVALASSRATLLACAVICGIYVWERRPRRVVWVSLICALIVNAGILFYRFSQFPDPFRYYRWRIWKHSLEGILDAPYIGVGLNMLSYHAARFNFPADVEIGRFARIAKSADNQYLQILAETGFLGLFTFLIAWGVVYFALRKTPDRFLSLRTCFIAVSVIALFSLPLNNTSILLFFIFLILIPIAYDPAAKSSYISFNATGRIISCVFIFVIFTFAVFMPFMAHNHFRVALRSENPQMAEYHLKKALRFNPYQPYYRFAFVKRIVDNAPDLENAKWHFLAQLMEQSIDLNPLDPTFYIYKARIYRKLLERAKNIQFYTQAVSSYQAAVDCSPYHAFIRAELASFYLGRGRLHLAHAELQKALELEPAFLNARLLFAETKLRENNVVEARNELSLFEKYRERLERVRPGGTKAYVEQLKTFDPRYKDEVTKLIAAYQEPEALTRNRAQMCPRKAA